MIFGSWFSEEYSPEEAKALEGLKKLYLTVLETEPNKPDIFSLNNGFPKETLVDSRLLSLPSGEAIDNSDAKGNYFANSEYFTSTIESYLKKRNRRIFGGGKKGDMLALALKEWIHWANNRLPRLKYDNDSLKELINRKKYLTRLITGNYFTFSSFIRREVTKFDTFSNINTILNSCIQICKEEEKKQSVRENLSKTRAICVGILNSSLRICCLMCDENAHEIAFIPPNFMAHSRDTSGTISHLEWNMYERILNTENGKILKEVIYLSGLSALGFPEAVSSMTTSTYFDDKLKSINLGTESLKVVNHPWQKDDIDKRLLAFQNLGEIIIEFSDILKILNLTYDIVGGRGDQWVSEPAKIDFENLLLDIESTLQNLILRFTSFMQDQVQARIIYNRYVSSNWNSNFSTILTLIESIEKNAESIKEAFEDTKRIISNYPMSSNVLNEKEILFINRMRQRKGLEPIPTSSVPNNPPENSTEIVETNLPINALLAGLDSLRIPILDLGNGSFSIDSAKYKENYSALNDTSWNTSKYYQHWACNFVTEHLEFFKNHHIILNQLKSAVRDKDFAKVDAIESALNKNFRDTITTINNEKPQWKFKYYIIPVAIGWPFHIKAINFARSLTTDLENKFLHSMNFIKKCKNTINSSIPTGNSNNNSVIDLPLPTMARQMQDVLVTSEAKVKQATTISIIEKNSHQFLTSVLAVSNILPQIIIPSSILEEEKVESNDSTASQTIGQLMQWNEDIHSLYFSWKSNNFEKEVEFFTNTTSAENSLKHLLVLYKSSDLDTQEMFIDSVFTLYRELCSSLRKPVLTTIPYKNSLDQIKLLSCFLNVIMNSTSEDFTQSMEAFNAACKNTFDNKNVRTALSLNYSSHGLLRTTKPTAIVTKSGYVEPSLTNSR
jgi:hypothetical protein